MPQNSLKREIYFHEDDYCQIQILPLSLWDYCLSEMNKINEFSNAHKAEIGWTDIYIREETPQNLTDLAITVEEFKQSVELTLKRYEKVTTGYSSHVEECENCLAWGIEDRNFTIFADTNSKNLINAVWLEIGTLNRENSPVVTETFKNLPKSNELMIADWNWSNVAAIGNEKSLTDYLAQHFDEE